MTVAAVKCGWRSLLAVVTMFALGPFGARGADNHKWQLGLAYSYSSGEYGSDSTTKLTYIPVGVKRYFSWGDLSLTVPYVGVSTKSGATVIQGEIVPTGNGEESSESGLGDTLVKGRYFAVEENGNLPYIDLALRLRIPTADEDKGLGSGDPDVTFSTELTKTVGTSGFAMGELGYTLVTDSLDLELDNRFLYSLGYAHQVGEKAMLSSYLDGRTSASSGADDPLSLLFMAEYRFRPNLRFDLMLEWGLSDGSPDTGVMLGVRYRGVTFPRPQLW